MIFREHIIEAIKQVKDPEIGLDIWTLGLIYDIQVSAEEDVYIKMTYTTSLCPFGKEMSEEIHRRIKELKPKTLKIEVVFDPPWQPSGELRAMLGV